MLETLEINNDCVREGSGDLAVSQTVCNALKYPHDETVSSHS